MSTPTPSPRHFTSDNNSGVIPEVLESLFRSNDRHMHAYGGEEITKEAESNIKEHFGSQAKAFFVFNGTAANVCALQAMGESYHSVICSEHAHLHKDECASPEIIARKKLLLLPTPDAKITPEQINEHLVRRGDQHCTQANIVSITQPTELGTVYSLKELKAIGRFCKENQLLLHMDGSRLVNAAAALGCSLKEMTTDVGVDVVCLGGTKNGLMLGEAVVFLNPNLGKSFKYIRKQNLQLAGKMRFISQAFSIWLSDNIWLKYAKKVNELARYLESELIEKIPQIEITQKVQSNVVFAKIPKEIVKEVRKTFFFYVWDENAFECRLMLSFDNTKTDIDDFVALLKQNWPQ
jgi:threonine aldolase